MNRASQAAIALVALTTLAFQLLFFDRWINFMDEGHILAYADIIARGGQLYRDATVYPLPGSFYFLALLFQIFEPSILLARWVVVIQYTLFVTLVFVLLRRAVPLSYALATVVAMLGYRIWSFPHWHMYSYSTSALLIFLVCATVLVRYFETGDRRLLAAAGLAYGFGVLCKQDYGLATLVAVTVIMVVHARSLPAASRPSLAMTAAWFLGPASLVGLATGAYFLYHGILGDLIQFTVLNHFVGMSTYEYRSLPDLFPLFAQDAALRDDAGIASFMPAIVVTTDWQVLVDSWLFQDTYVCELLMKAFFYAPPLVVAAGAARLVSTRARLTTADERMPYLRELVLFALAAVYVGWANIYKPQDYVHAIVLYWPLIPLAAIYACALARWRPRLAIAVAAVVAVPATVALGYTAHLTWLLRTLHDTPVPVARAGIYAAEDQARNVGEIVEFFERSTDPEDRVAVLPYSPLFSFLMARDAPHRTSYILWPFAEVADRDRKVIEAMESSGTDLLLYDFVYFHDFPRVRDYAPELFDYLVDEFEMGRVFTSDALWPKKFAAAVRKPARPRGRALLDGDWRDVDVVIEADDRPSVPIAPDERAGYAVLDRWPFRPVLALRPSADGRRTVLSVPLDVPAGARLETAVGVKPVLWDKLPQSWVRFTVAARVEGRREVLFERELDTTDLVEDRRWFDVHVPLDAYAGQTITLELSTTCERERAEHLFMGGWGEPRIVVPEQPSSASTPPAAPAARSTGEAPVVRAGLQ